MGMNKSVLGRVALKYPEKSCMWPLVRLGPSGREDGNVNVTPLLKSSQWLPNALRQNKYKLITSKVPLWASPSHTSPYTLWA